MPCYPGQILKKLIQIPENGIGCWLWIGPCNDAGYPTKTEGGRTIPGARWVWTIFNGPAPSDMTITSGCADKRCVHPFHLRLRTWAQVNQDNNSRLSISDVKKIREDFDNGVHAEKLADDYKVDPSTIYRIAKRSTWKGLPRKLHGVYA